MSKSEKMEQENISAKDENNAEKKATPVKEETPEENQEDSKK